MCYTDTETPKPNASDREQPIDLRHGTHSLLPRAVPNLQDVVFVQFIWVIPNKTAGAPFGAGIGSYFRMALDALLLSSE